MKFHIYSLEVSTNVKTAMQCFENVWGGSNAPNTPSWLRACVAGRSIVVSGCISAPASWTNDQRLQQNFNCLSAFIIKLFAASPYSCRSEDERHCCTQRQFTSFKSHKTAQQSLQSCPLPINNVWQVFGSSCNSCQEQYYITYRCATSSFQSCTQKHCHIWQFINRKTSKLLKLEFWDWEGTKRLCREVRTMF